MPETGLCYQVVMGLMRMSNYLNKAYHVFCDNYFTGVQLASDLLGLGTYLTGTLRRNRRHLPKGVKAKIAPGEVLYFRKDSLLALG